MLNGSKDELESLIAQLEAESKWPLSTGKDAELIAILNGASEQALAAQDYEALWRLEQAKAIVYRTLYATAEEEWYKLHGELSQLRLYLVQQGGGGGYVHRVLSKLGIFD